MPTIDELEIADEAAAWSAAGFDVEDRLCRVGRVLLRLTGSGPRRGIVGWHLGELGAACWDARATPCSGVARSPRCGRRPGWDRRSAS